MAEVSRDNPGGEPLDVVVAEPVHLVRVGLSSLLASDPRFCVVGEVASPDAITGVVGTLRPTLLMAEICFGDTHVYAQLRELCADSSLCTRVVVVSHHGDPSVIRATMSTGVHAFLPKNATVDDLFSALECVADDRPYLHPALGSVLARSDVDCSRVTDRESDILILTAKGLTTEEIADRLYISARSVEGARALVREKTGASTRAELVEFASEHGYLGPSCSVSLPPGPS